MKSFNISVLSLIQTGISFIYQIFLLRVFGFSNSLDIYIASSTVNLIIVGVSTTSINYAITPQIVQLSNQKQSEQLKVLMNSILNTTLLLFIILALVQFFFSVHIVSVLFPGFDLQELNLLSNLFSFQAFISIISISIGLLTALHYAIGSIYQTIIFPIIGSLTQITFVYLTVDQFGIYSLVIALFISQSLILLGLSWKYLKYYRVTVKINNLLKTNLNRIYPLLGSSLFSKSGIIVDRYFASNLISGSISVLNYSQLIINIATNFLNKGISIVSLKRFSELINNKGKNEIYFISLYKLMLILSFIVTLLLISYYDNIIEILSIVINLSTNNRNDLYWITILLTGNIVGGVLSSVIVNTFYSKGLTALVSRISIVIHLLFLILKIIAFQIFGFYSLAIVMSLKSLVNTSVLFHFYHTKVNQIDIHQLLIFIFKNLIISLLIIMSIGFMKLLNIPILINILLTSLILFEIYSTKIREYINTINNL